MQHLYVMQNHVGHIKIGRSVDVELRRRALERDDDCTIAIVAVFPNAGHVEETMLQNLAEHRLIGEWFVGDDMTRDFVAIEVEALCEALEIEQPELQWPFALASNKAVAEWEDRCEARRKRASIARAHRRRISEMQKMGPPSQPDTARYHDVDLWSLIWRFEMQLGTVVTTKESPGGANILVGHREGFDEGMIVPRYTTDVDAALGLWPNQDRPNGWSGTAWDCCIAAVKARMKRFADEGVVGLHAVEESPAGAGCQPSTLSKLPR